MIIVTGATGIIGRCVVEELKNRYRVRCFVRDESDISVLDLSKVEIYTGSLYNKLDIKDCVKNAEAVIHLAGLVNSSNKEKLYKNNVLTTKNICEVCKEENVKLIYISSANTLLKNKGNYTLSKKRAEEMVLNSGCDYVIIRPTMVYDKEGRNDLLKIMNILNFSRIVPLIRKGKNIVCPLYVGDLVDLIKNVLEKGIVNQIINIGGGEDLSFREMITKISQKMNRKTYFLNIPLPFKTKKVKEFLEDRAVDNKNAKNILRRDLTGFNEGLYIMFNKG